jgi:flagellar biosynthesis protein FliR
MDFSQFLTSNELSSFFLLYVRMSALFVFFPFFSSDTIPPTVKAALSLYLTILFYAILPIETVDYSNATYGVAVIVELLFAFTAGLILKFVFSALQYAGELISFIMGFSMATTIDPTTSVSMPMISQFLNSLALLIFLLFDGHHLILLFMSASLEALPLGTFVFHEGLFEAIMKSMMHLFILGFSLAFPIIALSLLSDIIFGMIMKTMPAFNLLVIGFPAKIIVAFGVFVAVISSMMVIFKSEFMLAYNILETF